jgi:hypothetical protein
VEQAEFLVTAWSLVLGRLRDHRERATSKPPRRRARRPKHNG